MQTCQNCSFTIQAPEGKKRLKRMFPTNFACTFFMVNPTLKKVLYKF